MGWGEGGGGNRVGTSHSPGLWPRVSLPQPLVLMDRKGQRLSPGPGLGSAERALRGGGEGRGSLAWLCA